LQVISQGSQGFWAKGDQIEACQILMGELKVMTLAKALGKGKI